jgi:hypothetical protein
MSIAVLLAHPRVRAIELRAGAGDILVAAVLVTGAPVVVHAADLAALPAAAARILATMKNAPAPADDDPREIARRLGALRLADPAAWEGRVRDAMAAESGRVQLAAGRLAVSTRTLMRWLAEPALRDIPRHAAGVAYGPRRAPLGRSRGSRDDGGSP